MRFLVPTLLAAAICGSTASAGFLPGLLVNGANSLEDQDRDAFVDVDGDDLFSVGDVLLGFVRIDDINPGVGNLSDAGIGNTVYGIFSQEVLSITPNGTNFDVGFGVTTVAGYTLADLTGDVNAAGGSLAVYSSPASITNLIDTSPGDLNGSGTVTMDDYLAEITSNMTLDFVAGIVNADDYFTGLTTSALGAGLITTSLTNIPTIPDSTDLAAFGAGLTITYNANPGTIIFNESNLSGNGTLHELVIGRGTVAGMANAANNTEWGFVDEVGGVDSVGGFTTDADIFINVDIVPEPSSVLCFAALAGFGVAGAVRRRRRDA